MKVEQTAKLAEPGGKGAALRCDRVVPFDARSYPGYGHVRTKGDAYAAARDLRGDNVVEGAKTYVFKLTKEALAAGARGE